LAKAGTVNFTCPWVKSASILQQVTKQEPKCGAVRLKIRNNVNFWKEIEGQAITRLYLWLMVRNRYIWVLNYCTIQYYKAQLFSTNLLNHSCGFNTVAQPLETTLDLIFTIHYNYYGRYIICTVSQIMTLIYESELVELP